MKYLIAKYLEIRLFLIYLFVYLLLTFRYNSIRFLMKKKIVTGQNTLLHACAINVIVH